MRKMMLKAGIAALAMGVAGSASAADVIVNGGFERGNFAGWAASSSNADGDGCNGGWVVGATGGYSSTTCNSVANPQGSFAAYNSFDGTGPKSRTLSQSFAVGASVGSAMLGWSDTYNIQYCCSGGANLPRVFSINIVGTSTANVYLQSFPYIQGGTYIQSNFLAHSLDITTALSAFAGQTVQLQFFQSIPESFSGPAGFGLDSVSLDLVAGGPSVPEPSSWALMIAGFGLVGAGMRRRAAVRVSYG